MNRKDILIVCGLEEETVGELEDYQTLYTGVGKVNATLKLTQRLHSSHLHYLPLMPKLVINYGTAGSRELPIGELVDCTKFIQRDMDCAGFGILKGQTPFEDTEIVLDSNSEFNPIGKHYVCGTGDNFVDKIENEIVYVDVFDMEAYALARVCSHYEVPFISFKYITDNANEHSLKDWEDNLADGIHEFRERVLNKI
tara:strand:+ start:106 stop:696 length:591 start_codon:yes stop_codon:yes gene_type:complete